MLLIFCISKFGIGTNFHEMRARSVREERCWETDGALKSSVTCYPRSRTELDGGSLGPRSILAFVRFTRIKELTGDCLSDRFKH